MKILQVVPTLGPGGAEGFVTNLGVNLARLGAEVRFFLMAGARGQRGQVLLERLRTAGIEVTGAEVHNVRSPMNVARLVGLIRSWRPSVVQANLYSAEVLVAAARGLAIGTNARYVRRLADTNFVSYRSPTVVRLLDRFFTQTIACSCPVADAYRIFLRQKRRSQLVTVPNGGSLLDSVPAMQEKRRARRDLDIHEGAFVIAHIGRMFGGDRSDTSLKDGQKAHDVLINAFTEAFGADPDCLLVLMGDGPSRPEAEYLAQSLGIEKNVRFLGQQPEPWPALKAADVFCFPSRHEGLPNVLPEAASCGLPVVASDIPEIRSLYPGDAWLLKPVDDVQAFADGLRAVRVDSELFAGRARQAADGFRKQFSMTACAKKYLQAYEWALRRNNDGNEKDNQHQPVSTGGARQLLDRTDLEEAA